MIKSVSYSQAEILSWIRQLYCPHGFDVDPTYGRGGFYTNQRSIFPSNPFKTQKPSRPLFYSDRYRSIHGAWTADARALPLKNKSIRSIIIDPPFLAGGGKNFLMAGKYGRAGNIKRTQDEPLHVFKLYRDIMTESYRILKPYGVLVCKCQDMINGRTQYLTHIEVTNHAISLGMYPKDVFIYVAKTRPKAWNHKTQNHARKYHSYFLVFGKQKRTVGYSICQEKLI